MTDLTDLHMYLKKMYEKLFRLENKVDNLNVNVTGVPSDPMQARKAAIQIKKELAKLDREGLIGTGIRGR